MDSTNQKEKLILPRNSYYIIKITNKSKNKTNLNKLSQCALFLTYHIKGCRLTYVTNNEIIIYFTPFQKNGNYYYNGEIMKIVSMVSSIISSKYNILTFNDYDQLFYFETEVFAIPTKMGIINYFIDKNNDAITKYLIENHKFNLNIEINKTNINSILHTYSNLILENMNTYGCLIKKNQYDWIETDAYHFETNFSEFSRLFYKNI
jgi:hypothetical protein